MKIALIQSALSWGDVKCNLDNFDKKLANDIDCDIILLPEMFTSGCMMIKKEKKTVEAEKEKIASYYEDVKRWILAVAERQQALVMGSTVYSKEEKYYNRLIAAFPDGRCEYYDKRHCFRIGGENEHFEPGKRQVVVEFLGMKIALFICYDLRFPVWSRNIQGYDMAVYIANWPESRREVWKTLLRARAIENQCYVAGVNCVGLDDNGLRYAGDSAVVNAWGELMTEEQENREETIIAEIDLNKLHDFRRKFPVLDDRDIFEIINK